MQGQEKLKFNLASALSLALACAGCLVTHDLDFTPNRSRLNVELRTPVSPSPVPSADSPDCRTGEISFVADYYYEDVDVPLTVLPVVNDQTISVAPYSADPSPDRGPLHTAPLICVSRDRLGEACNRVELFVSDDPSLFRTNVENLRNDPRVLEKTWFLIGPSGDSIGSDGKPYTSFYDCLPPDGGT